MNLNRGVHYVGKLNMDAYGNLSDDIQTDDTVLTDERIEHIKGHHPGDYETYGSFIPSMLQDPDYLIKSDIYATAISLKSVQIEGITDLKLILRLRTSTDNPNYMNSVISFQRIHLDEFVRLINKAYRDEKLLYKRPEL